MELVLSPGRLGGENNAGSPFHNQEIREWSHVDRLTGMLEHARVETGRWEARHQGTAQAYGKVIDSRERNSADGNVVQKARRQVEVFQSQGIGGRSVQVVRASQWSSSRITDSSSSSPVSVSMNDVSQLRNGNDDKSVNGRLSSDESLAKLSQVSRLCRQINGETMQQKRLNEQTQRSPVFGNRFKSKFDGFSAVSKDERNKLNSSSLIMNSLKSTSNEDLTKSVYDPKTKSQTVFTRDCKARRSLQIPKSVVTADFDESINNEIRVNPEGMEFVERNNSARNSPSSDHDISVLKNDRKRVKSYVLGMEEADSEAISSSLSLPKPIIHEKKILFNGTVVDENGKDNIIKSEYLRPTPILLKPKSNTTVVHLNNKLFLESEKNPSAENETVKSLLENETTIRSISSSSTTSRVQSLANRFSNGNNFKSINGKVDSFSQNSATFLGKKQSMIESSSSSSSSRIEGLINRSAVLNGGDNSVEIFPALVEKKAIEDPSSVGTTLQQVKPVKKVGFCKTEVHFAAESGKVNIVETDCKPPPSNRFRRRRRNSIGMNTPISQNKNLPLIHFGDTSYEKYIFGQSNGSFKPDDFNGSKDKPAESENPNSAETDSMISLRDKISDQRLTTSDELNVRDGWRARLKTIMKSEPPTIITADDENDDVTVLNSGKNFDAIEETIVDHSFKGSHTTTVNLGANVISKIHQKHTNEDNIDENEMIDDELDNIVNSDLPEEEVCFESNRTVEKTHNIIEKMTSDSNNVVTSDNENNKVLMNIVTTHEPVIARVEDSHSPEIRRELYSSKKLRSHSGTQSEKIKEKISRETHRSINKSFSSNAKKTIVKENAKDHHCDNNKSGKELAPRILNDSNVQNAVDPTYVNVFENVKKTVPIYENYRVTRKNNLNDSKKYSKNIQPELNAVTADVVAKSTNVNCDGDQKSSNTSEFDDENNFGQYNSKSRDPDAKLASISESNNSSERNNRESHKIKTSKTRSKRIVRPPSSTSSIESLHRSSAANETAKDSEAKPLHAKSTRSSRLHRVTNNHETSGQDTVERYTSINDKKKILTSERTSTGKVSSRSNNAAVIADTSTATNSDLQQGSKNLNDSTRSKKPIEIVYQTAVFNMKNEKLAKSSKSKESKTPRYINDLICGSRPKRGSTDVVRHVKGTSLSQQRTHHKSASPTNRHWK